MHNSPERWIDHIFSEFGFLIIPVMIVAACVLFWFGLPYLKRNFPPPRSPFVFQLGLADLFVGVLVYAAIMSLAHSMFDQEAFLVSALYLLAIETLGYLIATDVLRCAVAPLQPAGRAITLAAFMFLFLPFSILLLPLWLMWRSER